MLYTLFMIIVVKITLSKRKNQISKIAVIQIEKKLSSSFFFGKTKTIILISKLKVHLTRFFQSLNGLSIWCRIYFDIYLWQIWGFRVKHNIYISILNPKFNSGLTPSQKTASHVTKFAVTYRGEIKFLNVR